MDKLSIPLSILSFLIWSSTASANLMFDFAIDSNVASASFGEGLVVGDTFSINFIDDSNFLTGISMSDIDSVGYDIANIGQTTFDAPLSFSSLIFNAFNFTDLGAQWQLDLVLGVTGVDSSMFHNSALGQWQIGTTDDGSGPTTLIFRNANDENAGFHLFQGTYTFTASANKVSEVPEPTILALIGIGLTGIGFTRKKRIN